MPAGGVGQRAPHPNSAAVQLNGGTPSITTYNAANQISTAGFTYDNAGNLANDGTAAYTYDALNRTTARGTTNYAYNGDGTLVDDGTTRYTQDLASPLSQVVQTTQGSATTQYLYGMDRLASVAGSTRTWYGTDALGSVRQTLSDNGAPLGGVTYDPWGAPESGTVPTFGFTGELHDTASGLVNLRARWYSTARGQFMSVDPFAGRPESPYSQHQYQYGLSDPVLYGDPSGRCATTLTDVADCPIAQAAAGFVAAYGSAAACVASGACALAVGIAAVGGLIVLAVACEAQYTCPGYQGTYNGPPLLPVPGPAVSTPGASPMPPMTTPVPSRGAVAAPVPLPSSQLGALPTTATNCDVQARTDNRPPRKEILVIGESRPEFEYTTSLALMHPDWHITTTTYGLAPFPQILLGSVANVTLVTNVDARHLDRGWTGQHHYDAIIFNNPHVGAKNDDTQRTLTAGLISQFVLSARGRLNPLGEVHVNVTEALTDYPSVQSALSTSTYNSTFGASSYFAPYVPRYSDTNRSITGYYNPLFAARLKNYVWR